MCGRKAIEWQRGIVWQMFHYGRSNNSNARALTMVNCWRENNWNRSKHSLSFHSLLNFLLSFVEASYICFFCRTILISFHSACQQKEMNRDINWWTSSDNRWEFWTTKKGKNVVFLRISFPLLSFFLALLANSNMKKPFEFFNKILLEDKFCG